MEKNTPHTWSWADLSKYTHGWSWLMASRVTVQEGGDCSTSSISLNLLMILVITKGHQIYRLLKMMFFWLNQVWHHIIRGDCDSSCSGKLSTSCSMPPLCFTLPKVEVCPKRRGIAPKMCCKVLQNRKRWSFDSSSCWWMTHQDEPTCDLFIKLIPVGVLFMMIFHIKSWVRGGDLGFQSALHHPSRKRALCAAYIMGYPTSGEYTPWAVKAHMRSSSPLDIWTCDSDNTFM